MPEIPDLELYAEALNEKVANQRLVAMRVGSPFLIRSVSPSPAELAGLRVMKIDRYGKQILWQLQDDAFIVLHLMIAGRLHWKQQAPSLRARNNLAVWSFEHGHVLLTESSKKKRAAVHLVRGKAALSELHRGGLDVQRIDLETFAERLRASRHTLKRALTDQRVFAGIGNAYSDEILHAAKLSPFKRAAQLGDDDVVALFSAARDTLQSWTNRLRKECGGEFPKKVTAFRPEMAVHGKFREPCPVCGAPVQRIVYAENEANYCPGCQTNGKVLADRALSKLLRDDWPKTLDDLEGPGLGLK